MIRWYRASCTATLLAVVVLGLTASVAFADKGVAIDLGAVDVTQRLSRGGIYQLPTMGVRNPGSEQTSYVMAVGFLENQPDSKPPTGWFSFSPAEFELGPGETQAVLVELSIPTGARPDTYRALLEARIGSGVEGVVVGAGAAAPVSFAVKPSNVLQAWQLSAQMWLDNHAPWPHLVPVAALVGFVVWLIVRKFEFTVVRRME